MKRAVALVLGLGLAATACTGTGHDTLRIGAIYPLTGSQGPGGVDEHRGVMLAAELANADAASPDRIELVSIDVTGPDGAPEAIRRLAGDGIDLVLGSYGSTISAAAAPAAAERGLLFWETGAVGMLPGESLPGDRTFQVPPTGALLGTNAIAFVADRLADRLHRDPADLRYAVSFVDDAYGRSVARGALDELRARHLRVASRIPYDFRTLDADAVAREIAHARTDVLFVSAYLQDAIALRQALLQRHVPLVASIGTSSSYCMPEFGQTLGHDAVGLFASDKPAAAPLNTAGLTRDAAALLARANAAYRERWGGDMSAPALAGFSAARGIDLPSGSLPNGSGLHFGAPGTPDAGDNLAAASVIWEWVTPGHAEVVWPPAFATYPISPMDISS